MTIGAHSGSCFCGAVSFVYTTSADPADWSVRACQCAFCRKHFALSTSDPDGELTFAATDTNELQRYRFALQTADFLICRRCGVYVGAVIETPGGRFGIINLHALDASPAGVAAAAPVSYAGESVGDRKERRSRRWTPVGAVPWD